MKPAHGEQESPQQKWRKSEQQSTRPVPQSQLWTRHQVHFSLSFSCIISFFLLLSCCLSDAEAEPLAEGLGQNTETDVPLVTLSLWRDATLTLNTTQKLRAPCESLRSSTQHRTLLCRGVLSLARGLSRGEFLVHTTVGHRHLLRYLSLSLSRSMLLPFFNYTYERSAAGVTAPEVRMMKQTVKKNCVQSARLSRSLIGSN